MVVEGSMPVWTRLVAMLEALVVVAAMEMGVLRFLVACVPVVVVVDQRRCLACSSYLHLGADAALKKL